MATKSETPPSSGEAIDAAMAYGRERLGLAKLKPEQETAIRSFALGKDVFVCLPTGYGKSVCFTMLPFVFDHLRGTTDGRSIVICVSPLQSLMMDQRQRFSDVGLTVGSNCHSYTNNPESCKEASGYEGE